ncbi:hypothetical protein Tco_1052633 [Tanacetum coccineum]
MVISSSCLTDIKNWLVQEQTAPVQKQTALGKDISNPLIVDSLLKTIWLSIHLVVYNEELAIPEQTTTAESEDKEFQVYKVIKELKFIKEQIKELK